MGQLTFHRVPILMLLLVASVAAHASAEAPVKKFANGLPTGNDFFPIAVWLQEPRHAAAYKAIGINLYVGLWDGPSDEQLKSLEKADMPVILEQNDKALKFVDRKIIVGWMHDDEPDNAQDYPGRGNKNYNPPILPSVIQAEYQKFKTADPTRPIMLNLGQSVAWDNYIGRGVRRNHPEDYPEYVKGADIISFDIYPVTSSDKEVTGKMWKVSDGVERLVNWTANEKPVWNCIECTHIGNARVKPTPAQVKSEVWMSIIAGTRGLVYFCHEFAPKENDRALLTDSKMAAAVKAINAQIKSLAAVINTATAMVTAKAESSNANLPIALMTRRRDGATFVFAVAMRPGETTATFTLSNAAGAVEVIGEDRVVPAKAGTWQDSFNNFAVHLYKITD